MYAHEDVDAAPQNLDAEEHVLGACLLGNPATYFAAIESGLRGTDFYRASHGIIFRAIGRLVAEGVIPDSISVVDALERERTDEGKSALEVVGGRVRVNELAALVPATANVAHHAEIVRSKALVRGLIEATSHASREAWRGASFDDSIEVFEEKIEAIRTRARVKRTLHDAAALAERFAAKRLNPPSEEEDGVPAPRTFGMKTLRRGSLYTIAGYTGDGKTCAGIECAATACAAGLSVGIASLEMTGDEVFERLVARYGVPYEQAQTGRIAAEYQAAAVTAEKEVSGWRLEVEDDEEIRPAEIRRWAVAGKYDLVIVDHLHRIEFADRYEIEKTVRSFKNMAKRLGIPVVMLAQLSRTGDRKHPYPPPTLASLRETAVIEHESAFVGFVYRERNEDDPNEALPASRWIVAKNRFGKTGGVRLFFHGDRQAFTRVQSA